MTEDEFQDTGEELHATSEPDPPSGNGGDNTNLKTGSDSVRLPVSPASEVRRRNKARPKRPEWDFRKLADWFRAYAKRDHDRK